VRKNIWEIFLPESRTHGCPPCRSKVAQRHKLLSSLYLLCAVAAPLVAVLFPSQLIAADNDVLTGTFEGSGRACYGKLAIRSEAVSWTTPFSSCRNMPYEILEQTSRGSERRIVYSLQERDKSCLWGIIVLRHRDSSKADLGWDVTAYVTLADYESTNEANSMSCYLYKME
jgi:hypothetical protein